MPLLPLPSPNGITLLSGDKDFRNIHDLKVINPHDFTWIHTLDGECYLSTYGIGHLERKLNPQLFIRIHRSYIINIEFIQELYRDISKLFIALPNNVEVNVGRNYMPAIKELMF